jgi:hypothetical protein
VPLGDNRFACAGQVPRAHSLVNDVVAPRYEFYDVALMTELGRQSAIAAVHRHLEVPFEDKLIFTSLDHTAIDPQPNDFMPMPVPIEIYVTVEPTYEDDMMVAAKTHFTYEIDGKVRVRTTHGSKLLTGADYKAFRSGYRARKAIDSKPLEEVLGEPPIDPAGVGRLNPRNVFIAAPREVDGGYETLILPDQENTLFFDHPDEHVPATQLIEALTQVAIACAARTHGLAPQTAVVTGFRSHFLAFAELDSPLMCEAKLGEPSSDDGYVHVPLKLTLRQSHAKLAKCNVTLRFSRPEQTGATGGGRR